MKYLLTIIFSFTCVSMITAQITQYSGRIAGMHEIEMELESKDDINFTGKYHNNDTIAWLALKGEIAGETQSNLQLKEFDSSGKQTGSFNLFFDGDNLHGTWQAAHSSKTLGVALSLNEHGPETNLNSKLPDGYYYADENEMKVKTIDDKTMEVGIWINNQRSCTGILLRGKLLATPNGWTAVLNDEYEHGAATVTMRFEGNDAQVLIVPKFAAGECRINISPYTRGPKKKDSELD